MPELKIDHGEVESSVGAKVVGQRSTLRGLTLPDIHAPLYERQKGDGVRDE